MALGQAPESGPDLCSQPTMSRPAGSVALAGCKRAPARSPWLRQRGVLAAERLAEEALDRLLVAPGAEQEVDCLARAVDRSIEIAPLATDPEVSFIDVPGPAAGVQVAPQPLLELGGVPLEGGQADGVGEGVRRGTRGAAVSASSPADVSPLPS
jgi:hypothetical protein